MPDRKSILTPDQRLRVFVSSTLQELAEERKAARQAIERLRLAPVMFELGARPHPPRALYRAYLDQSHVFVGIYWQLPMRPFRAWRTSTTSPVPGPRSSTSSRRRPSASPGSKIFWVGSATTITPRTSLSRRHRSYESLSQYEAVRLFIE